MPRGPARRKAPPAASTGVPDRGVGAISWVDVVVAAEHVRRIDAPLDRDQPLVRGPGIGAVQAALALLVEEVRVHTRRRRGQVAEIGVGPGRRRLVAVGHAADHGRHHRRVTVCERGRPGGHASHRTAEHPQLGDRHPALGRGVALDDRVEGTVVERPEEVRPQHALARFGRLRGERVDRRVRHRAHHLDQRLGQARTVPAAAPASASPAWTGITTTAGVPTSLPARRAGRQAHHERDLAELLGGRQRGVHQAAEHLLGERQRDHAGRDDVHRVQPVLEPGRDAEVAAAATERPEQVRIVVGAHRLEPSIGGHQVHRHEAVDREAVLAHQPPDAAPSVRPPRPTLPVSPNGVANPAGGLRPCTRRRSRRPVPCRAGGSGRSRSPACPRGR